MRLIYTILTFSLLLLGNTGTGQNRSFTKQQIQEDLNYLKEHLLREHPNLFVYNTKSNFDTFFEDVVLPSEVTSNEAYGLITSVSDIIQDGHTLFYPDYELIKRNNEKGSFIPISVFWDGANLFMRRSYSSDSEITKGTKIISINGVQSERLIAFMLQRMMRDGNNFNYPIWVINQYFFEYYSYFYDCPKMFQLLLEHKNGKQEKVTVGGLPKADLLSKIKEYRKEEQAINITFNDSNRTAILTIKDWHNNVLKKYYKQNFNKEITEIFKQIREKKIENIIIDVRNNQGGDTKNSRLLLSYLLDQPFELVEGYKAIKNGHLATVKGPQMGIHQSKKEPFTGKVLVLINGGSFSNTAIFCSVLRKHNRAIFIGEETGGSKFIICGHPKTFTLPNTKIQVDIPRLQFLIKSYTSSKLGGIKPNHIIKPTIEQLVAEKDVVKEFAIQLVKESKEYQSLLLGTLPANQ